MKKWLKRMKNDTLLVLKTWWYELNNIIKKINAIVIIIVSLVIVWIFSIIFLYVAALGLGFAEWGNDKYLQLSASYHPHSKFSTVTSDDGKYTISIEDSDANHIIFKTNIYEITYINNETGEKVFLFAAQTDYHDSQESSDNGRKIIWTDDGADIKVINHNSNTVTTYHIINEDVFK